MSNFKLFDVVDYRKDKWEHSQHIILSTAVLYNIARDINEESPGLPKKLTQEKFDELMERCNDNTPTSEVAENKYFRDKLVQSHFSRFV